MQRSRLKFVLPQRKSFFIIVIYQQNSILKVTEAVRQKLETATRLPEVVAPEAVAGHWALRASLNRQPVHRHLLAHFVRKERKQRRPACDSSAGRQ